MWPQGGGANTTPTHPHPTPDMGVEPAEEVESVTLGDGERVWRPGGRGLAKMGGAWGRGLLRGRAWLAQPRTAHRDSWAGSGGRALVEGAWLRRKRRGFVSGDGLVWGVALAGGGASHARCLL